TVLNFSALWEKPDLQRRTACFACRGCRMSLHEKTLTDFIGLDSGFFKLCDLSLNHEGFETFMNSIGKTAEGLVQAWTAGWFAQMHRARQRTADAQTSPPARPCENP
ncbi:MAG: hypothetical protein K9K62_11935, partial [Desulfobacteraceae bacterium]|nr:hypothetical protein [Desulfobacteraceae bacterium]